MDNVQLDFNDDILNININGECIGSIGYSINPHHNSHYYLKPHLQQYDIGVAKEIFALISSRLDKPLQVMLESTEKEMISFIQETGFCCKRKCYECEVLKQDYIGERRTETISYATKGNSAYEACCEIMLDRYIATHKGISPWTGIKEDFFALLPQVVFYELDDHVFRNFAFVEDNEIAYVYGTDRIAFINFAQRLITELFEHNEMLMFEADDCDEYALELRKLFANQTEESCDTYIR